MTKRARSLEFDPSAFEDLSWWIKEDRKTALRRIDQQHRLVYEVKEEKIRILACRYHY